jgi:hypothetical protein
VISPEYDKARCIFDPYAVAKFDHFFSTRLRRSDRPLAFAWLDMERDAVSRWGFVVPHVQRQRPGDIGSVDGMVLAGDG